MMKYLAIIGLLVLPAMASAQTMPAPAPGATASDPVAGAEQRPETPLDARNFCYFEGKAYSKGAVRADQVCSVGGMAVVTRADSPAPALVWMPAPTR